jgi:hypothetical protein
MFILVADRRHFCRTTECIVNSVPTNELVNTLLDFNPWPLENNPTLRPIFPQTPSFLWWLKRQATPSPSLIIIRLHCGHSNLGLQISSSPEMVGLHSIWDSVS